MEIRESITFDQVYAEATTIWYAVYTCWWTHNEADVREATILGGGGESGIPLDPRGSVLMWADGDAKKFLDSAKSNAAHYGKHGLRAFMAAHHRNAFENSSQKLGGHETGKPTSAKSWSAYNDAIDRFDLREGAPPFAEYEPVVPAHIYDNQKIVARCVICNSEFTEAQTAGHNGCPKCGDKGLPSSPDQDVTVKINWHELRILCIWAEFWANRISKEEAESGRDPIKTVWAIAGRLQDQYPSHMPLTLSAEIGQLGEKYDIKQVGDGVKEGAPLPPKIS